MQIRSHSEAHALHALAHATQCSIFSCLLHSSEQLLQMVAHKAHTCFANSLLLAILCNAREHMAEQSKSSLMQRTSIERWWSSCKSALAQVLQATIAFAQASMQAS